MAKKKVFMTEDEWEERFNPYKKKDGCYTSEQYFKDQTDQAAIETALKERRLWTMVETDSGCALLQGARIVNFMYYVICRVPYGKNEDIHVEEAV